MSCSNCVTWRTWTCDIRLSTYTCIWSWNILYIGKCTIYAYSMHALSWWRLLIQQFCDNHEKCVSYALPAKLKGCEISSLCTIVKSRTCYTPTKPFLCTSLARNKDKDWQKFYRNMGVFHSRLEYYVNHVLQNGCYWV